MICSSIPLLSWIPCLVLAATTSGGKLPVADLTDRVHEIFSRHCSKCHGPQVERPKGKFGYLTDLKRVWANPKYVIPGRPEDSRLYLLIEEGEMPPPDSDVPGLSEQQKQIVLNWIATGAAASSAMSSGEEPHTTEDRPSEVITDDQPSHEATKSSGRLGLRQWIGRMHPATVHLPIGLILAAALAELLGMVNRRVNLGGACRFCIVVGALGAVVSALLGWWNAEAPHYAIKSSWELFFHRWIGVATAVTASTAAVLSPWSGRKDGRNPILWRLLLFVSAALVGAAGMLGGVNVYGWEHYRW